MSSSERMYRALSRLVGSSEAIRQVREQLAALALAPIPILILGETGTGKEVCADVLKEICEPRPFVAVNCACFSGELSESELFGHRKGAFTGAVRDHVGLVAQANGGTLFLDELAELLGPVQAKLLRALESGEYRPVGGTTHQSQFRLVAATNGDLDRLIVAERIRADLLHRMGAVRIILPPLRDRVEDIPLLADMLLKRYLDATKQPLKGFAGDVWPMLMRFDWPGNVRQLRNVIEAAAVYSGEEPMIGVRHVLSALPIVRDSIDLVAPIPTLAETRRKADGAALASALSAAGGNRERAADLLDISEATLYRKLKELALDDAASALWGASDSESQNPPRLSELRGHESKQNGHK